MGNVANVLRHSGDRADGLSPPWVLSLIFISAFSCLIFATGFSFVRDESRAVLTFEESLDFKNERPRFKRSLALARKPLSRAREESRSSTQGLKLEFAEAGRAEPKVFERISTLNERKAGPYTQLQSSAPPPKPEKIARPKKIAAEGHTNLPKEPDTLQQGWELQTALRLPQWRKNAVNSVGPTTDAMVAIVIDDLGLNRRGTNRIVEMKGPYTLSFISYAERLGPMLKAAKRNGHELMLHLPMEPFDKRKNAGPKALMTAHAPWEIRLLMEWGLSRVQGIVGVNNHMGSRFTSRSEGMAVVMDYLRKSGLFYLDSRTGSSNVSEEEARAAGVPFLGRDVFLDHRQPSRAGVLKNLRNLEAIARRRGYAVAIAHPYSETLEALSQWRENIGSGVRLVPISAIVKHRLIRSQAKARDRSSSDIGG